MNLYEGRLLQDEVQDKETKRLGTWMQSKLSARDDVRKAFSDALEAQEATPPSTSLEKRLERLVGAFTALARQAELRQGPKDGWWCEEIRKILAESA